MIGTPGKEGQLDLDIAGSSTFGRDPKIMSSRTFNMILADGWLVDYFGYKKVIEIVNDGKGRGIFTSIPADRLIVVIDNMVYSVSIYTRLNNSMTNYNVAVVGEITSHAGDVFIDENNTDQIAICDKHQIYIYNHVNGTFDVATLPDGFIPGYVTYQNGRFVAPDLNTAQWALSNVGDGLNWFWGPSSSPVLGGFQTKPDLPVATLRVPGKGNLLYVMGSTVTELWTDVSGSVFPYQKNSSVNYDYGCVNSATLAASDEVVAWLGQNEKSGPVIMYAAGNEVKQISTDGINYKLSKIKEPEKSSAFFVKLSGHLIYQLTFYGLDDNYSLIYDFTTGMFFDVTDEQMNYHIARHVSFFNNSYYFISFNDGNIYQMSPDFTTFDYGLFQDDTPKVWEIPRVRTCRNIRAPNTRPFVVNNVNFCLEQGNDTSNNGDSPNYQPQISLSLSVNGGISFGNYSSIALNTVGNRVNTINWYNLGLSNDFVTQFRFWGKGPWRATNGQLSLYQ